MSEYISYFLLTFTSLFTITNPLSAMPFYNSLVEQSGPSSAKPLARKAALTAFLAMVVFSFGGKFIFDFFGVSIDGLRVVGSILFAIMGYDMLQGKDSRTKQVTPGERIDLQDVYVKAITPLAIPIMCGPGAITVLTVSVQEATSHIQQGLVVLSALLVSLSAYFILVGSDRIVKVLGVSGQKVFFRIMGLVIMMVAVEYFFVGIKPYVQGLLVQ